MKTSAPSASAASSRISHMTSLFPSVNSRRRVALTVAAVLLAGCAVRPVPAPAPAPAPPPAPRPTPAPVAPVETRAVYEPIVFEMLPATGPTTGSPHGRAFLQTCRALAKRDAWREACAQVDSVDGRNGRSVQAFFAARFDAYRVIAQRVEDERVVETRDTGLMTGYYEPLLRGSRARNGKYTTPIYRVPPDLLIVDLASVHPELQNLRLRGKLQGRRVVPYPSRADITNGEAAGGQRTRLGRRSGRGVLSSGAGLGPSAVRRRHHDAPRLWRPERPSVSIDRPLADRPGRVDARPDLDARHQGVDRTQSGTRQGTAGPESELRVLSRTAAGRSGRRTGRRARCAADTGILGGGRCRATSRSALRLSFHRPIRIPARHC